MPATSWAEVGQWVLKQIPDLFVKRKFNFITIHYCYMIGMTILGSVILFGIGDMAYIDALFFASGAATQSGLNTIDVDLIAFGQQFWLYFTAMFCNPIVVHSFVVFVRLYWFEKRFTDVVREARQSRLPKARSRNSTRQKDDPEAGRSESGVRDRAIRILRNTGRSTDENMRSERGLIPEKGPGVTLMNGVRSDGDDVASEQLQHLEKIPDDDAQSVDRLRLPPRLNEDQHITFLENLRNPTDGTTLRIPSPREYDRGGQPKNVEGGPERDLEEARVNSSDDRATITHDRDSRSNGPAVGNHIIIDEPHHLRAYEKTSGAPPSSHQRDALSPDADDAPTPLSLSRSRHNTFNSFKRSNTSRSHKSLEESMPYLSYEPTVGRNSFFVGLSEEQREELGGIEYRALKTLALILICYFFFFHILGAVCLVPWIMRAPTYGQAVTNQGQGRPWWGIFTAASAFNDLGFTLTNDSMIEFGTAVFPMLLTTILIVIGNTGFPCMLRFIIWVLSICVPYGSGVWEELRFLLDHPRRCFTLLFPSAATWWLFAVLVVLNGIDLMFFVVLDLRDPVITNMAPGIRFLDGLFQASSTRTAGFAVVNLSLLHPAIQVSYLIMMYISVFPIAISMRRTNVYEEKSLGIYGEKEDQDEAEQSPSYVGAHLRKQLGFDLWFVFLGLFVVAVVEGDRLQDPNDYAFNLFCVLFEIVSAYGTVGLSLGYPTINASFSAEFKVLSKLVIIGMQIRGRHRGLPYELDRAILLPSESLQKKEEEEAQKIMRRRRSSVATSAANGGQINSHTFKPENGVASGRGGPPGSPRQRANGHTAQTKAGEMAEEHRSRARAGLGSAMFGLASAPDTIRDAISARA